MSSIVYLSDKKKDARNHGSSLSLKIEQSAFYIRGHLKICQNIALYSHGFSGHCFIDLFRQIVYVSEYISDTQVHSVQQVETRHWNSSVLQPCRVLSHLCR